MSQSDVRRSESFQWLTGIDILVHEAAAASVNHWGKHWYKEQEQLHDKFQNKTSRVRMGRMCELSN